jgi:hypothetical protein
VHHRIVALLEIEAGIADIAQAPIRVALEAAPQHAAQAGRGAGRQPAPVRVRREHRRQRV